MRLIRAKFRIKNSILGRFCKFGRFFALKMGCSCCRVMECEPFVVEFWQVSMLAALGIGFNPTKFKPQMNMAIQRFRLQIQKKAEEVQRDKREIMQLLTARKFDSARIRGEAVYRKQREVEGLEIVQLMAELVFERTPQIAASDSDHIPDDLRQAIATLAWATDRVSVSELEKGIGQLKAKYGHATINELRDNPHNVHPRVWERLTVSVPPVAAVKAILVEVAAKNSLTFTVEEDALFLESLRDDTPFMSAADRLAQKTAELEEHLKPRGDDGPAAKPPARTVMMGDVPVAPVAPGFGGGVVTLGPGSYPVGATTVMPPQSMPRPAAPEPTYPPAGLPPQYGTPMGPPPPYAAAMLPFPGVAAPTAPAASSRTSFTPTPSTMGHGKLGAELSPHELPTPPSGSMGSPALDLPMPPLAGHNFPQPPVSSGSTAPSAPALDFEALNRRFADLKNKQP